MIKRNELNLEQFKLIQKCSKLRDFSEWSKFVAANSTEINLQTANFSGMYLENIDLEGAYIENTDFESANLAGANFQRVVCGYKYLSVSWLEKLIHYVESGDSLNSESVDSSKKKIMYTNFKRAILNGTNFREAQLSGIDFEGAVLEYANFEYANLEGVNFEGANLKWANFNGANLKSANLQRANLEFANFNNSNLDFANFVRSRIKEGNFQGAKLKKTNLKWAGLQGANFQESDLDEADFQGADLMCCRFKKAILKNIRFEKAILLWSDFRDINFSSADLRGIDFSCVDFEGSILRDADLRRSKLIDTNLTLANITGAKLYGTSRDDWVIDRIICNYVAWDKDGIERTPKDRDFESNEFEDQYKSLPEITYYFSDDFTPVTPIIMDKVVNEINRKHRKFELKLNSFQSRGIPHAIFTVLHKDNAKEAMREISFRYEKEAERLKGENDALLRVISKLTERPQYVQNVDTIIHKAERIEHMGHKFGDINSGHDTNIAAEDATLTVNNIKNSYETLITEMAKHNVSQADIDSLKIAIEADKNAPEHNEQSFGQHIKKWLNETGKAVGRIVEGTTAGTAANAIGNLLKAYYGWM